METLRFTVRCDVTAVETVDMMTRLLLSVCLSSFLPSFSSFISLISLPFSFLSFLFIPY